MSDTEISAVLGEMRRLAAAAGGTGTTAASPVGGDFASMFKNLLGSVNQAQQHSADLARAFELGTGKADVADVMINMQKARLSFQITLQVRNKLVAAYQDIMNMPL